MSNPANYDLVLTIDPIRVPNANTERAKFAHSFAKKIGNRIARELCWSLSGDIGGDFPGTTIPGVKFEAHINVDPTTGKAEKVIPVPNFGVPSKVSDVKIKVREAGANDSTFDLDSFLATSK